MTARDCDPCEGPPPLPDLVSNRPGLAAVAYRIGTFPTFRRDILLRLHAATVEVGGVKLRPLAGWNARDPADFGGALIDAWCYLADVLTFYQERTANEAFLRTAVFPDSLHRLARTLGYRPAPGSAAAAVLAFTLEPKKRFTLPAGVRVGSVPGPGEKPQKFETSEALPADAGLNRVRARPVPTSVTVFKADDVSAVFDPGPLPPGLAVGNNLIYSDPATGVAEEKQLTGLVPEDGRVRVNWAPPLVAAGTGQALLTRWSGKFGLFGATAPETYPVLEGTGTPPEYKWKVEKLPAGAYAVAGATLALAGQVDTLRVGGRVLVVGPGVVLRAVLKKVELANATFAGQTQRVTQITTEPGLPAAVDRRFAVVYQLDDPDLPLSASAHPAEITGDTVLVPLAGTADLTAGRRVVLGDAAGAAVVATVRTADPYIPDPGTPDPGAREVAFDPPLPAARPLESATAYLLGNVAAATHGETVPDEVLGDGDPAVPFQAFRLAKGPVTYLPSPGADRGVAAALEVRVNGVRWDEVPTLFGRSPAERVYVADRDDAGRTTVRGGDGVTAGAAFERGVANVVARYRFGLGAAGNVPAGALRTLLVRPPGVRSATNPFPAAGGADAEAPDRVRENAPNTVRTFGRVVSLTDFADAAREYPGVAKASAAWDRERHLTAPPWDDPRGVRLVVAGADGALLSAAVRAALKADLDARRDPYLRLTVVPHKTVPLEVAVAVLTRPEYDPPEVEAAVAAALVERFAFPVVAFGRAVHLSDVFAAAQAVGGVAAVDVDVFRFKDPLTAAARQSSGPIQPHARLFPDELPTLAAADVTVTRGSAP